MEDAYNFHNSYNTRYFSQINNIRSDKMEMRSNVKKSGSDDDMPEWDYATLPADEIHERLIWQWLHFFRQNTDFKLYCSARRIEDVATCKKLEREFKCVADLYDDWGDIHKLRPMNEVGSPRWKKWFRSKQHLFLSTTIDSVESPIHKLDQGRVLATIPIGLTKKQLEQAFNRYVDSQPGLVGAGPKYKLAVIKREKPHETLSRLERANLVHDLLSGEGDFKHTHAKIAAQVLQIPLAKSWKFNWFPNGPIQKAQAKRGKIPLIDLNSQKRTVINLEKFHTNCVNGTIHGVFPATLRRG